MVDGLASAAGTGRLVWSGDGSATLSTPYWYEPRHPDHYHWITARLDARGARVTTCRTVAGWIILGGLPPTILALGIGAARWEIWAMALTFTGSCLALALLWVRGRWPTSRETGVCLGAGITLVAFLASCWPNPVAAAISTAGFVVLSTFAAVFFSLRTLIACAGIAAIVITAAHVRWAHSRPDDLNVAIASGILLLLVTAFAAIITRTLIGLIDTDHFIGTIEPVTGLLTRDSFNDGVAQMLGTRARSGDRYLTIIVISLDSFAVAAQLSGAGDGRALRVAIARRLRETARRDTVLAHCGDTEFLVADVFTTPDPSPLTERLRARVNDEARALTASIGCATTALDPALSCSPQEVVDQLLVVATEAAHAVRSSGGNGTRHVHVRQVFPSSDDDE